MHNCQFEIRNRNKIKIKRQIQIRDHIESANSKEAFILYRIEERQPAAIATAPHELDSECRIMNGITDKKKNPRRERMEKERQRGEKKNSATLLQVHMWKFYIISVSILIICVYFPFKRFALLMLFLRLCSFTGFSIRSYCFVLVAFFFLRLHLINWIGLDRIGLNVDEVL